MTLASRPILDSAADDTPDGHLFVSKAFNQWQAKTQGKRLKTFSAIESGQNTPRVNLTLAGKDGIWTTPITGAFGGLAVADRPIHISMVDQIVEEVMDWLKGEKAESCLMRLPPASFDDPTAALLQNALARFGWSVDQTDINYHLDVCPAEKFYANLGDKKKQEIRRLRRVNAQFLALPEANGRQAYDVIARNRVARGYPMTMAWDAIAELAAAFPEVVRFYGVTDNSTLMAAAICLQVTAKYLYVFYWGEDPDFRKQSPVMLLVEGLVSWAHQQGVEIIDVGISTEKSVPNPGLMGFKAGIGCKATSKMTYRYNFS